MMTVPHGDIILEVTVLSVDGVNGLILILIKAVHS